MLPRLTLSAVVFLILFASSARAVLIDFAVYRNPGSISTLGVQPVLDVTESAGQFHFTLTNLSTVASSLTFVYFEGELADLMSPAASVTQSAGVSFGPTAVLQDPTSKESIGWGDTAASYRSLGTEESGKIANGVNSGAGEFVTLSFDILGGAVLEDVLASIGDGGRIALHLRDLNGDDSVLGLVSLPVPEPAALAALPAMALLSGRRRSIRPA